MKISMLVLMLLTTFTMTAQRVAGTFRYQGGKEAFSKNIFGFLGRNNGLYANSALADSIRQSGKYFTVLFKVEQDGTVNELVVSSYNDSSNTMVVEQAVRETSGQWLNKTGAAQWVVLPLYFLPEGADASVKMPLIQSAMYDARSKKKSLLYLDDLIIQMGPTVY